MPILLFAKNGRSRNLAERFSITDDEFFRKDKFKIPDFHSYLVKELVRGASGAEGHFDKKGNLQIVILFYIREDKITILAGIRLLSDEDCFWGGFVTEPFLKSLSCSNSRNALARELCRLAIVAIRRATDQSQKQAAELKTRQLHLQRLCKSGQKFLFQG